MKAYIKAVGMLAAVMLLAAAAVWSAAPASAAGKNLFGVRFEKEAGDDARSITLTAVLEKQAPDEYANTMLAALQYDRSQLSITEEDITVLSGGMCFRKLVDAEKGIASVECGYLERFPEPGAALVSFRFTLLDGVDAGSLNTDSIRLCADDGFLSDLSDNYAGCGGILLTDGFSSYSVQGGHIGVSFELPPAPGDHGGGCSSSSDAAAIAAAVLTAGAVMTVFRARYH